MSRSVKTRIIQILEAGDNGEAYCSRIVPCIYDFNSCLPLDIEACKRRNRPCDETSPERSSRAWVIVRYYGLFKIYEVEVSFQVLIRRH